ncbi:YbeD family protein [Methyloparacoccus murrellii]
MTRIQRIAIMTDNHETLLEFPCEFPIKVFGHTHAEFESQVIAIILRHARLAEDSPVQSRKSQGGKYDAVTVTITATSKPQLDAIYLDLTASPDVIMAL